VQNANLNPKNKINTMTYILCKNTIYLETNILLIEDDDVLEVIDCSLSAK
jgi:hypothetical protein